MIGIVMTLTTSVVKIAKNVRMTVSDTRILVLLVMTESSVWYARFELTNPMPRHRK